MQEKEGRMSDFDVSEAVGELENMVNAAWDAGYAKGVDWAKKCGGGIDAMTDTELAEHGLMRLPVDADGVRIDQGDIVEFCDKPDGEQMPVVDASYSYGMGNWVVTVKRDVGVSVFSTVILRHVAAAPAPGTPRRWRTLWTR